MKRQLTIFNFRTSVDRQNVATLYLNNPLLRFWLLYFWFVRSHHLQYNYDKDLSVVNPISYIIFFPSLESLDCLITLNRREC